MKKAVITIGRQFGAGGRSIGKKLAEMLEIGYYDNEILHKAAQDSGLSEKYLQQKDETHTSSFLYSLVMGTRNLTGQPSLEELTWQAERNAVISAAKENCVIVGRCADYILKEQSGLLRVFIMADDEKRMERIAERDKISQEEAMLRMKKMDKRRAAYYNMYTENQWGHAGNYDLCINTAVIKQEKAVEMILMMIDNMCL